MPLPYLGQYPMQVDYIINRNPFYFLSMKNEKNNLKTQGP